MNQLRGPTQIKLDGVSVKPREIGQNRQIFGAFYVQSTVKRFQQFSFPRLRADQVKNYYWRFPTWSPPSSHNEVPDLPDLPGEPPAEKNKISKRLGRLRPVSLKTPSFERDWNYNSVSLGHCRKSHVRNSRISTHADTAVWRGSSSAKPRDHGA